jgi:E3 ubiquitin-protein ligase HUWE1
MNPTLHTVLLLSFQRAKGLEAIFRICKYFTDLVNGVTAVKPEDRTETMQQEIAHAQGGLKVALNLLYPLLSSKPLIESSQTSLVTTREKKDTESDYFEPHHFLVGLRLESIPLLRNIWEASWLRSSPLTLVRSVVQIMLEVTAGENEELKGDPSQEGLNSGTGPPAGSGFHIRAAGPDENRIRQLTDMGFPRSAAERALARTHNNVNAATELLLSQPYPFPPDPQPNGSTVEQDETGDALADGGDEDPSDEEMDVEDAAQPAPPAESTPPPQSTSEEQGKGLEELRKDLEEAREILKKELPRKALQLVDEHPSLIFEVHRAFMHPTDKLQEQSIRTLIDDIQSFSPAAYDVHEQPLAARCRLLAIVLSESPTIPQAVGQSLMDTLLALLLSNSVRGASSHPKWLASHLLVTEALFTIGEQPFAVVVPKENEPVTTPIVSAGPAYTDARPIIFDFCLRLLGDPDLPRDDLLSALRLLVLLTRDHGTAFEFIKHDGLPRIFSHLKGSAVPGGQSYAVMILRHIAEGLSVLQHIMKQEIKRLFSQPRTRIIDVSGYMRNCSAMALRDPSAFIQVTQDLCQLQQPYSAVHHITLKPGTPQSSANIDTAERNDMQIDQLPSPEVHGPDTEALETMVHFLISELMKNVRFSSDNDVITKREDATQSASESVDDLNDQDRHSYCCFIMQCLTELLFSYDACKLAFLSYSPKKKMSTPAKDPTTKHRTAVLQFFLSELITFKTIASQPYAKVNQAISLCTCAMSVLVALCVDSSAGVESKDVSADLISVRKFTLEAISRAIKEFTLLDTVDARYGHLLALADLCNRLLTVRFNNGSRKSQDESTTHIAKIMLEKNFVSILTSALAEVDLNYPNVRGLVASILRPMENL